MFSEEYSRELWNGFACRMKKLGGLGDTLKAKISECPKNVQEALWYLYGTMPLSDIANYPLEMIADFAVHGAYLWKNGEYEGMIPERIFTNYVLQHRVNDEEIEACRTFFYEETQELAQGKTMEGAAREINYWCAGEASYHTEDDRTASAMSVYRAGEGRCGEESVFVVNALRSAGVPARQVYAPYWSHCDDNHAWVEVWCDGEWHFLGACEPEEALDRGWFVSAASRAMMVHTPYFERTYAEHGMESKTAGREKCAVLLNELHRYADTVSLHIKVQRPDGTPMPGAQVRCLVMNYASLLEVANGITDADGCFVLETGKGSMYIEAAGEGMMGAGLCNTEKEQDGVIHMSEEPWNYDVWEEMECYAPKDGKRQGREMTLDQKRLTKKRADRAAKHLAEKREEIEMISGGEGLAERLTEILAVKDLRETDAEFIARQAEFAEAYAGIYPKEIFNAYLLQPRIGLERMTVLADTLGGQLDAKTKAYLAAHPGEVRAYVEERVTDSGGDDYKELLTAPGDCLRAGFASEASREILIASIFRVLGIPSRLSAVDETAEYYRDGSFRRTKEAPTGRLFLEIPGTDGEKWNYREDYSVAFLKNGAFVPCKEFRTGEAVEVPEGIYRICTANRLPNGNVYAKICYKKVTASGAKGTSDSTEIPVKAVLEKKSAKLSEMLSQNQLPTIQLRTFSGEEVCASRPGIYIWAEPGKEPTEHIFNELIEKAEQFRDAFIAVITKTSEECGQKTYQKLCEALPNIQCLRETDSEQPSLLARKMYDEPEKFPFILVLRRNSIGIYAASGYNVGTADMLLRMIEGNCLE